jgi:hypothetical protein
MSENWNTHIELTHFNRRRLNPQTPTKFWRDELHTSAQAMMLEGEMIERELENIRPLAGKAPLKVEAFLKFENLRQDGPGQHDPLFDWLATTANLEQMRWFIQQEVAGEAGFEDLTALTQIKFPTRAKLEMARNFWDEMGRGTEKGMHGPMLAEVAIELNLPKWEVETIVPEALALSNILTAFAANRRYAYHSIGALGVIELTAPDRAAKVHDGLKRLGIGSSYYLLHSAVDIRHSQEWNKEVIRPLLEENIQIAPYIAEGALLRLYAGARCFERYRSTFAKASADQSTGLRACSP